MFSTLLPGVRELRAPLVTGALWAAVVWLVIGHAVATSGASRSLARRFEGLEVPTSAWLVVGAFMTYLIGSLLVVRASPFTWLTETSLVRTLRWKIDMLNEGKPARRPILRPATWFWGKWVLDGRFEWLSTAGFESSERLLPVRGWLLNEFDTSWADGRVPVTRGFEGGCMPPSGFEAFYDAKSVEDCTVYGDGFDLRESLAEGFVQEVLRERDAVEVCIHTRFPSVYAEIERLRAEGELRLSIFWPLMTLIIVLAVQWTPWAVVLLFLPPWLARDGFRRLRQAADQTWGVLMAREVTSPTLEAMKAAKDDACRDFARRHEPVAGGAGSGDRAVGVLTSTRLEPLA